MPGLWICLIILNVQQAFEDVLGSKRVRVLKWHGCICKGYIDLWICLNVAQCALIMAEYTSICLNVPQYTWPWMNIAEYPWICPKMLNKLFWLCQRSHYAPSSYIFDRVSHLLQVLNIPEFWICRDIVIITLLLL